MENSGHTRADTPPDRRDDSSSSTPPPQPGQGTPTENELARALLSLSFSSQYATPTDRPPSRQLPGSYPETPLPRLGHVSNLDDDAFHTPVREPQAAQSFQYPKLDSVESTPEPERMRTPTPTAPLYQLPSPEQTPEPSTTPPSKTLVVLHDACIQHKFSRSIKARDLASIVERPERCRASVIGIAAAKARLDIEDTIDLSFDIVKSNRLGNLTDQAVLDVHGSAWPVELTSLCDGAAETLSKGNIEIPAPYHSGDLYLGDGSHEALRGCIGSVYDGVDRVLGDNYDRVHVSVRPPGHHCAETMPSGFCMINNVHVAIAYAHRKYDISRAVILDFDLHHGDGSQAIAWNINQNTNQLRLASRSPRHTSAPPGLRIGYFSLHDIYSFPCEEGAPDKVQDASLCLSAHGQTIWNVHIRHHPTDALFDQIYGSDYSTLFKRAAAFLGEADANEKCMVFLSAGFDASEHETKGMQRHGYNLPTHFYQRFASDAISLADRYASGKILSVLEGGYADRAITSGSFAYMVGLSGVTEESVNHKSREWWSVPRLTMLEKCAKKPPTTKSNHGSQSDIDSRWISDSINLSAQLLPAVFISPVTESSLDPNLTSTPRMGLRERKKAAIPATAPPSAVKKRQQRVATPRTRKSMGAADTFTQDDDTPPLPTRIEQEREMSPGAGLSGLMQTMNITNQTEDHANNKVKETERSLPGTPTPAWKGTAGETMQ
jgi:acetoin utilization deacetylase AcuC-like enzyme